MAEKIKNLDSPRGLARLAWRAPIWFYRMRMGGLFGERMLLLNHIGRKSGQVRQNVLEVVRHDKQADAYIVASGFGKNADWYKNVAVHPDVKIQVGRRHVSARAERLPVERAIEEILDYKFRHPAALKTLAGILGYKSDGSDVDVKFLATVIPILAFRVVK